MKNLNHADNTQTGGKPVGVVKDSIFGNDGKKKPKLVAALDACTPESSSKPASASTEDLILTSVRAAAYGAADPAFQAHDANAGEITFQAQNAKKDDIKMGEPTVPAPTPPVTSENTASAQKRPPLAPKALSGKEVSVTNPNTKPLTFREPSLPEGFNAIPFTPKKPIVHMEPNAPRRGPGADNVPRWDNTSKGSPISAAQKEFAVRVRKPVDKALPRAKKLGPARSNPGGRYKPQPTNRRIRDNSKASDDSGVDMPASPSRGSGKLDSDTDMQDANAGDGHPSFFNSYVRKVTAGRGKKSGIVTQTLALQDDNDTDVAFSSEDEPEQPEQAHIDKAVAVEDMIEQEVRDSAEQLAGAGADTDDGDDEDSGYDE